MKHVPRVQFLKDTSKPCLPDGLDGKNVLVVYREGYSTPKIDDATYLEFEKYRVCYQSLAHETIIFIGLNRMVKPSNRCDLVFEYMQTLSSNKTKYSLDTEPFLGEPWRCWFHFSVAYGSWLNIDYSYAIETLWTKWFHRDVESCALSPESLKHEGAGLFYSDIDRKRVKFTFYSPNESLMEFYKEYKDHIFDTYSTPKMLITKMFKGLSEKTGADLSFEMWRKNIIVFDLPDLLACHLAAEENKRRLEIYNVFTKEENK
jgi:hypothetical protein